MLLGRNTVQWVGVIAITVQGLRQLLPIFLHTPEGVAAANTILDVVTAILGGWIIFIANTSTTPTGDPQLNVGTIIRATDPLTGDIVGHVKVPEPAPAPLAEDVGENEDGVA